MSSYATKCAAFSGIPREIVARAELYSQLQSRGEDLIGLIRGEHDGEDMKDLKIAEEIAKRFVAWDIDVSGNGRVRDELARVMG